MPSSPAPGSLFREVWRIERQIRDGKSRHHRVGHDGWPGQELVRFRTSQHLGYAGRDIVQVDTRRTEGGALTSDITVDCLGLTGARGALPAHYTEMVLAQLKAREPALRDFLDLFNHRLLSLFYRSWEKTQPAVHQERNGGDVFTAILKALTNSESSWEIHYGAALSRGARSANTIRSVLSDLTGMPVSVTSLRGGWQTVDPADQTCLPSRRDPQGRYAHLGEAILGSRVWMADKGADCVFYPADGDQLQSLLPGGKFSYAVGHLTRRMVSSAIQIRYRAVAAASHVRGARVARQGRLGADSFIAARRVTDQLVEVSFKPSAKEKSSCLQ